MEIVALDWTGEEKPSLGDLPSAKPLRLTHHAHKGRVERALVDPSAPDSFALIGKAGPTARFDAPCTARSAWGAVIHQAFLQWRWDYAIPRKERDAYARAKRGKKVTLRIGGGPHTLDAATWRVALGPGLKGSPSAIAIDPGAALPWEELDKLGALREITYHGGDQRFLDYLRARKMVERAFWREHGQQAVDLRGSCVETFGIDVSDGLGRLIFDGVDTLFLGGSVADSPLKVKDPLKGQCVKLHLTGSSLPDRPLPGLERLRTITAHGLKRADLERLMGYRYIEDCELVGAPGELVATGALSKMKHLYRMSLRDFYRYDVKGFPPPAKLHRLRSLELDGLHKSDAQILQQRLGGLPRLTITGAKNEAWIKANLDNPFRDWVDDDERLGNAACKAWRRHLKAISKATKTADLRKHARAFVEDFNRLHAKHNLDTLQSEAVVEAFFSLVAQAPGAVDPGRAEGWLESRREF